MNTILKVFKYLAYLQILFMLGAVYVIYEPIISGSAFEKGGEKLLMGGISNGLILLGFGLSLVSLRDHSKIDKSGRWVIERPKLFKRFVYFSLVVSLLALIVGIIFLIDEFEIGGLAIGLCSFSVGFLSLIKSLIDQAKALTSHY